MKKLILILGLTLLFLGCSSDKKEKKVEVIEEKTIVVDKEAKEVVKEKTSESLEELTSTEEKIQEKIKTEGMEVIDSKLVVDEEIVTSETASEETNQPIENEEKIIEEKINKMVQISEQQTVSSSVGKQLYLKCAGCHGKKAEKKALGKSAIVQGWSKEDISSALLGYKDGSYGGVMKGVMKSQVSNLSEIEINTLSSYMAAFK